MAGMSLRLQVGGVVACVLLASSCAAPEPEVPRHLRTDGPIVVPPAHGWSISAKAGDSFTDGLETMVVGGAKAVTILSVELIGDPDLELIGSLLRSRNSDGIHQYFPTFPPVGIDDSELEELVGSRLLPTPAGEPGQEILLGIAATNEGVHQRTGIRLTYEVQGESFAVTLPGELVVCADAQDASPFDACAR